MRIKTAFPDARTLILSVLVITSLAIVLNDPAWLAGLLVVACLGLWAGKVSLFRLLKRLRRLGGLIAILVIVHSLTNSSGVVILEWKGYVLISSGGALSAAAVLLRIGTILAAALLLTIRDSQQLITALVQMGVPFELAYMVLLGIRFIPVLAEEFMDALLAIQLRGVDLNRIRLGDKVRIYTSILMPVVAGALLKARRIATAMEARAFRAKPKRTWLEWPIMAWGDWMLIIIVFMAGIGCYILYLRGVRI